VYSSTGLSQNKLATCVRFLAHRHCHATDAGPHKRGMINVLCCIQYRQETGREKEDEEEDEEEDDDDEKKTKN
jgi:hypothetical protein